MLYSLARPLLFCLDPETAHRVTLHTLRGMARLGLPPAAALAPAECARTVMGIRFPNPVGVAAGLDKSGEYIDALARLGFGFIEIGTVTPRAQPGNPRPRMFRIRAGSAVINRMGFNNDGVDRVLENVARARYRGVLGINIGKNFDTPLERAADDYIACLRKVYPVASYVTVNISSPNTANLRRLQSAGALPRRSRHQHRQELRHAARARRGRLRRLPAQGLSRRELRDGERVLAQHREPAAAAGHGRARRPARNTQR